MIKESAIGMKIVIGALILSILLFVLGLFAGYFFDDIKHPSENEASVPAPTSA